MFASSIANICAVWNGLMRPCGESMNTSMPLRPRIATSADEPVSPDVAPRIVMRRPSRASAYSKSSPSSCSAMSLNASVGPFDARSRPSGRARSATIASLPNAAAV